MSKLIDVNKLLYEDIECTDGKTYMVINAYDVENAPIVQAIPLDKVKQAIEVLDNAYEDLDGYDPDALGTFKCKVDEVFDKLIESEE